MAPRAIDEPHREATKLELLFDLTFVVAVAWDGATPMRPHQRVADQPPGSPIRTTQESFNAAYSELLAQLEIAFNGRPAVLNDAVGSMFGLRAQCEALMLLPIDGGPETAGPTFEWVPPSDRR